MLSSLLPMQSTFGMLSSSPISWLRRAIAGGRNFFLLVLVLFAGGCSDIAYYWQAGMGQLEILNARQPISEVLEDPDVPEVVKAKLRLVIDAQAFGKNVLGLPEEHQFRYYSDIGREVVSWLVVASEAYALKSYQNCYFIAGCLGYRGFFDKADSEEFAEDLKRRGYDVLVRPVRAYSTLGWFDDPVLNTYIRSADAQLVATIFHEQAHGVLFVKGDTAFSESFSTFVEREGVRRYLKKLGDGGREALQRYLALNEDQERFRKIVLRGRERLERLYASNIAQAEMDTKKQSIFEALREDYQKEKKSFKIASYDGWFDRELNNAHLVGFQQYRSWLKAFENLFQRSGREFAGFFALTRELADMPRDKRDARLKSLESGVEDKRIADSRL